MTRQSIRKSAKHIWLVALLFFCIVWSFPVSSPWTRMLGVMSVGAFVVGVLFRSFGHPVARRIAAFSVLAVLCGLFLPGRDDGRSLDELRQRYVSGLRRYEGVRYVWGGESPFGVDCSGLVRRGLIDAMFLHGLETADPGLLRGAFRLWWRDTSARTMGSCQGGQTAEITRGSSINEFDHALLEPGDLAVTKDGRHVMAYLGEEVWIEADPGAKRVITLQAPAVDCHWFTTPITIVRWNVLR